VSLTSAPAALRKLSPAVHTYRLVFRSGGRTVTEDRITILNRRTLSMVDLYIGPGVPIHDEVDATKATLRAMHSGD
jgi:hypothetical protein